MVCLEGNKEDGLMAAEDLPSVNAGGEERAVDDDDGWLPAGAIVGRCAVLRLATKVGVVFATAITLVSVVISVVAVVTALVSSATSCVLDAVETPLGEVTLAELEDDGGLVEEGIGILVERRGERRGAVAGKGEGERVTVDG